MWHCKLAAFTLMLILSLGITITIVPPRALTTDSEVTDGLHKLAPDVQSQMESAKNESRDEKIAILILMEQQPSHPGLNLQDATGEERSQLIHSMKSRTEKSQKDVLASLEKQKSRGNVADVRACWIVNAIAVKATPEVLEELVQRPEVKLVEPDYKVKALGDTLPWGVARINAELVWNGTKGGTDVVAARNAGQGINVSILDTGIDHTHPDLADNYKGGYDFVNTDDDPMDDHGHGTHCAGIVAAVDNDEGVIGTAPEVSLYGVKVLNNSGIGYTSDLIRGIEWSVNNGMQIISMSVGTENYSAPLHTACNTAYNAGLLLVAAAGNDNEYGIDYPAAYETVIAVGAIDQSDARCDYPGWWGSDWGPELELTAPGVDIYSTYLGGTYAINHGTSMACPHVTGAAALVWRAYPDYSNTQIRERLQETAEDLGAPGRDDWYGYGLVDAAHAAADRTPPRLIFDTGSPANPFPSISGIHNGTITPSCNLRVSKLYTYPSPGTGGHTEYIRIWNSTGWDKTATWTGYASDWHNLSFDESFTLLENETYNYTIITGSYPQIIHEPTFNAPGGTITCTEFVDANGVVYADWIPAIRLE
ncbi:MAG: S8 family serine peptidase [Methanophagales archaeon]|nr:S8 family serine peptidase [Methanophagales archaeon]